MDQRTEAQAISKLDDPVAVLRGDGHYRVVATRAIAAGATILVFEGTLVTRPSRFSIQVGAELHLESPPGESLETALDRRPWRFLNHSCAPNARVGDGRLVALRDIAAWEQVTFDYNANEARLAAPFSCRCGSPDCSGEIRGWEALAVTERERRASRAAPWLQRAP